MDEYDRIRIRDLEHQNTEFRRQLNEVAPVVREMRTAVSLVRERTPHLPAQIEAADAVERWSNRLLGALSAESAEPRDEREQVTDGKVNLDGDLVHAMPPIKAMLCLGDHYKDCGAVRVPKCLRFGNLTHGLYLLWVHVDGPHQDRPTCYVVSRDEHAEHGTESRPMTLSHLTHLLGNITEVELDAISTRIPGHLGEQADDVECDEICREDPDQGTQFCFLPPRHRGDHEGKFGTWGRRHDDTCELPDTAPISNPASGEQVSGTAGRPLPDETSSRDDGPAPAAGAEAQGLQRRVAAVVDGMSRAWIRGDRREELVHMWIRDLESALVAAMPSDRNGAVALRRFAEEFEVMCDRVVRGVANGHPSVEWWTSALQACREALAGSVDVMPDIVGAVVADELERAVADLPQSTWRRFDVLKKACFRLRNPVGMPGESPSDDTRAELALATAELRAGLIAIGWEPEPFLGHGLQLGIKRACDRLLDYKTSYESLAARHSTAPGFEVADTAHGGNGPQAAYRVTQVAFQESDAALTRLIRPDGTAPEQALPKETRQHLCAALGCVSTGLAEQARYHIVQALGGDPLQHAATAPPDSTAPERAHHLAWNGSEWIDERCGCRYHPDDDNGSHGGAPHVHRCEKHSGTAPERADRVRWAPGCSCPNDQVLGFGDGTLHRLSTCRVHGDATRPPDGMPVEPKRRTARDVADIEDRTRSIVDAVEAWREGGLDLEDLENVIDGELREFVAAREPAAPSTVPGEPPDEAKGAKLCKMYDCAWRLDQIQFLTAACVHLAEACDGKVQGTGVLDMIDNVVAHVRKLKAAAPPTPPLAPVDEAAVRTPIPMLLHCPECGVRHVDVGEFATKVHHTHSCQNCGLTWRPAIGPTVGVQFLPGFKNEDR